MLAAEQAKKSGAKVVLDIDFRPDQWRDIRSFGVSIRAVLPLVDVVNPAEVSITAQVVMTPKADVAEAVELAQQAYREWRITPLLDRAAIKPMLAM